MHAHYSTVNIFKLKLILVWNEFKVIITSRFHQMKLRIKYSDIMQIVHLRGYLEKSYTAHI